MIVVSGASGTVGRRVVELLLRHRVEPARIVAVTRTPEQLEGSRGVAVRYGTFDDPDGLVPLFSHAQRLLLISTNDVRPGVRVRQHANAVRAAREAHVAHIGYTSMVRPEEMNPALIAFDHRETERMIVDIPRPWTFLRNNLYAETLVPVAAQAVETGVLAVNAGDGRVAWVSWEDCAAAAAAWLAHGGREREAVDVTGPYDHSYGEVAAILSDLSGRPVRYEAISDEVAVDAAVAVGVPEEAAASIASFGQAAREGWFEVVGPQCPGSRPARARPPGHGPRGSPGRVAARPGHPDRGARLGWRPP